MCQNNTSDSLIRDERFESCDFCGSLDAFDDEQPFSFDPVRTRSRDHAVNKHMGTLGGVCFSGIHPDDFETRERSGAEKEPDSIHETFATAVSLPTSDLYPSDEVQIEPVCASCEAADITSNATDSGSLGIHPNRYDVLLGRGKTHRHHLGNVRMHQIVNTYRDAYRSCSRRLRKREILETIVKHIKGKGGKFLKFNDGDWTEIPDQQAILKVGHAFRDEPRFTWLDTIRVHDLDFTPTIQEENS